MFASSQVNWIEKKNVKMYKVPTPCLISSPFFFSFDAVYWSKDTRHLASNWYFTIRKNGLFFLPFLPWVHHAASYNQTVAEWRCRSVKVSFSWVCGNHRPPFWGGEFTLSSWSDAMTSFRYIYIARVFVRDTHFTRMTSDGDVRLSVHP